MKTIVLLMVVLLLQYNALPVHLGRNNQIV